MALGVYCGMAAWCWTQAILQWRSGYGWFGIDFILAIGFTIAVVVGVRRLPTWCRNERLRRKRTTAEAMLAADLDDKCARCGYDLTGTASVKCPECGAWHGRRRSDTRQRNAN